MPDPTPLLARAVEAAIWNAAIEAAKKAAKAEAEPAECEMPAAIIERVLAQDTVYVERLVISTVRATKRGIIDRLDTLRRPEASDAT